MYEFLDQFSLEIPMLEINKNTNIGYYRLRPIWSCLSSTLLSVEGSLIARFVQRI